MKDNIPVEIIETLNICYAALKDHVQYEEGESSLEGDAFRAVVKILNKISLVGVDSIFKK